MSQQSNRSDLVDAVAAPPGHNPNLPADLPTDGQAAPAAKSKARRCGAPSALTVAIDGPAGAGKSSVSREVARRLGYALVDTGAIYRTLALSAQRQQVPLDDDAELEKLTGRLRVSFAFDGQTNRTYLGIEDVTHLIRTAAISHAAALISQRPTVRAALLPLQRRLAGAGGAVLEGRDVGTVVFPSAQVKVFLVASPKERARRRLRERQQKGHRPTLAEVEREQAVRDALDTERAHAPLRRAADAIELDSTHRPLQEVVDAIVQMVHDHH